MTSKTARRIVVVAALVGVLVFVRAVLDPARQDTTAPSPAAATQDDRARSATTPVARNANASGGVDHPRPTAARGSPVQQARVRVEVHAPSDVRVGEVFQARIDVQANVPVRDLMFSIVYENAHLAVVGRTDGTFVRQSAVPIELDVDEPSDGNIAVALRVVNGSATVGNGSVAVFDFEALRPGTSAIEIIDVQTYQSDGTVDTNVAVTHDRVTIR